MINHVSQFLTAVTPHVLEMFTLGLKLTRLIFFIFIIFALMLREFTSWLVFASFTAAPPHFTTIDSSMGSATPVKVFFLMIFLSAHFTHLNALVYFALSTLELYDSLLHLFALILKHFSFLR